jgi:AcrR family transcriptional regulator
VGGLYHYFPTKRDLVLYGFQEETLNRLCQNFIDEYGYLAALDPGQYLEEYSSFAVEQIAFVRPALLAAIELGVETFRKVLDSGLSLITARFTNIARSMSPEISTESIGQLERSLKRVILGAALDKEITPAALRSEIFSIFAGYARLHGVSEVAAQNGVSGDQVPAQESAI